MTGGVLSEIGEALYGPRWQSDMARDLAVAPRTLRFWLSGRQQPRPGVWRDILRLAQTRHRRLGRAIAELTSDIERAA